MMKTWRGRDLCQGRGGVYGHRTHEDSSRRRRGVSISTLAELMCRTKQAIIRVVIEERIDRLTQRQVRFIDDPLYHQPDAELAVNEIASAEQLPASPEGGRARYPRDLPAYLPGPVSHAAALASRRRALFLKFNFHKFQFVQARRKLEPRSPACASSPRWKRTPKAIDTKNDIIRANLRLVVSVARKHLRRA